MTEIEIAAAENLERAVSADRTLIAYAGIKNGRVYESLPETESDPRFWLADLLADLRHWARREDLDFDACDDTGRRHFRQEEADAEGGDDA